MFSAIMLNDRFAMPRYVMRGPRSAAGRAAARVWGIDAANQRGCSILNLKTDPKGKSQTVGVLGARTADSESLVRGAPRARKIHLFQKNREMHGRALKALGLFHLSGWLHLMFASTFISIWGPGSSVMTIPIARS